MVQGFSMVLYNKTDEQITEAFKTWMKTQSVLPTPADILEVCEQHIAERNKSREDHRQAVEATRKRLQAERDAIKPMTENEIQTYLSAQKGNTHSKTIDKAIDTKHFDSMPKEAQQAVINQAQASLKSLRYGQGMPE